LSDAFRLGVDTEIRPFIKEIYNNRDVRRFCENGTQCIKTLDKGGGITIMVETIEFKLRLGRE
jgi:hypothetical protein